MTHVVHALQLKDKTKVTSYQPGQQLDVNEIFKEGDLVDVAGITIGKGFQGKRAVTALLHAGMVMDLRCCCCCLPVISQVLNIDVLCAQAPLRGTTTSVVL